MATGPNKIRLSTNPTDDAIAALQIGDIVYLDGTIYTAREGVYMRVIEDGVDLPLDLPAVSAANFHCSPAATQHDDGSFVLGAVTATASFRFSKWIGRWLAASGAKLIIGKGGVSLVMQNLISNALKYSQKGQIIEVFSEPYGLGLLSIGVADEAGGLPEDAANRIFSPAGHESSSGTLEEQGTGVGLLLAQDLAEQMGTEIQLISDEKGSRFFLVFPTSTSQG